MALSAQIEGELQNAASTFKLLDESGNYVNLLNLAGIGTNNLPIGLSRTISNVRYKIAVSGFRLTPEYAEMTVYGQVVIPQSADGENRNDRVLFFGAQGIKLSYDGNIIGDAKLMLLGDISIPINGGRAELVLRGAIDDNNGRGLDLTYLSIDCNGFKEFGITAEVLFPHELIRKVDSQGNPIAGNGAASQVSASFQTVVRDWNDILVSVDLPNFEITGLNGFVFNVQQAVFDFSDYRNEPSITYPLGYQKYLIPGNESLWKGVYIREFSITLPKQFAGRGSDKRVSFAAQNMILDNNGISGLFTAANILSINNGSAGGWRFSVDEFSLELEANQLTEAGFAGQIGIPVSESTTLAYDAFISPGNEYFLKVSPTETIGFDIWAAKAKILPNSYVEFKVVDDKFYPEAMLNGSISIAARSNAADTTSKTLAKFEGVEFRKLHLRTKAPYLSVEYFGYKGEVSLMNFPLSISDIALIANDREAKIGFNAKLALGGDKFGITAETRLEVVGSMAEDKGLQSWRYKKIDVSRIAIDASLAGAFSLKGGLTIMNDDPTYGDGFAGEIQLKLEKVLNGVGAQVRAIFGRKDYRYWMVDGKVSFGQGIPVFPPVNLSGFGGGAYYHMRPDGQGTGMPTDGNYVPDQDWGLGLKAAVLFNVAKSGVIDGEAQFEIAFNSNGGLNFIGFYGQAKVLAKIPGTENIEGFVSDKFKGIAEAEKKFTSNNKELMNKLQKMKVYEGSEAAKVCFQGSERLGESGFSAAVGIQYDFTRNSLHSTFDLYLNMLGGMLQGVGSGNRAGWAVLHIDPDEWYMHLGTPTDRLGVRLNLANIIKMETGSYFMVGDRIPASPPPPKEVADILGVDISKLDYMRDLNALGDGRGFAFGSDFRVSTGDITFLMIYAKFMAGLGFDIMLKDYGDAQCKGRSGPIGMNGWYANGQTYVYLQGELGIKINLLFIKKKIPIIKAGAATLMQAKLPNPAWFVGYLGVKFDLLGGLVKGRVRLKISLGEECEIVMPGGSPLGIKVINDITPVDNSNDVDVFAAPQVAFNMPVGKAFEMEDDDGVKKYKLVLDELSVYQDGAALPGKVRWNSGQDAVEFYSHEILPPNVPLKAFVRVTFEEYQNGRWLTVYTSGKKAEETMEVSFTTGTAPDVIPLHNIEYAYPVLDQRYFYPREATGGYVQLKRGQSYLFSSDMRHEVQLIKEGNNTQSVQFTYSSSNNRLEYSLPSVDNSSQYTFDLVTFSKGDESTSANTSNRTAVASDDENEVTVRSAQASQVTRTDAGKSLLSYSFKTSKHKTFAEKMSAIAMGEPFIHKYSSDVFNLQYEIGGGEPFDVTELVGTEYSGSKPLVSVWATLEDEYYANYIHNLIYKDYSSLGFSIKNRDTEQYGVPPAKAIPINTSYLTEVENGIFTGVARHNFPYIYDLARVYQRDYLDLRGQISNRYITTVPNHLTRFFKGSFAAMTYGYYKIMLEYRLPGEDRGNQTPFEYYNFFK
jgi:hypothetical protein